MHKKARLDVHHLFFAMQNSKQGLFVAWQDETAFRFIMLESALLIGLTFLLADTWTTTILLIFPVCLAILVELLNTAIENTVDRIGTEWHPLAKKAKDMGSAAQLVAQLFLLFVWLSYFFWA
ncbi:MAG: diacylglycerol kinase [Desulfovibrio sp.]|nr:diacylglycerol kinase [Desulfovibrio sp.]